MKAEKARLQSFTHLLGLGIEVCHQPTIDKATSVEKPLRFS